MKKKVYYVKDRHSHGYADGLRGWVLERSAAFCFDVSMGPDLRVPARQWAFAHARSFEHQPGISAHVVSVKVKEST